MDGLYYGCMGLLSGIVFGFIIEGVSQANKYAEKGVEYNALVEQKQICETELPRNKNCTLTWYWEPVE